MTRRKRKKEKSKKILKATLESDDEDHLEEFQEEFCFIANDEEEEIDDELSAIYRDLICN